MSQRLPNPGSDDGTWGDILNGYLEVSHASDGTLNNNVVGTAQLQDGAVTNAKLDSTTQSAVTKAASSVQTVNSKTPDGVGNVALAASDVSAIPSSDKGAASGVATLDGSSKLTASQIPSSVAAARSVISIAYSATITPALPAGDAVFVVGTLTGALTINTPSGTPIDGQMIQFIFQQDATGGRAITYSSGYAFGTDVTAALDSTGANQKWRRLFAYNAATATWQALAIARGF